MVKLQSCLVALVAIGSALACSSAQTETASESELNLDSVGEAIVVMPPASAFVVLARHGANIQDRTTVTGNVGVAPGAAPGNLLTVGSLARSGIGKVSVAQRVSVGTNGSLGDVAANQVTPPGANITSLSPYATPPLAPMPDVVTAGTTVVNVGLGQTTTLAAGSYSNVTVSGTLNLSGGTYQIRSLTVNNNARVVAQSPSSVKMVTGLTANDRAHLLAASGKAGDLRLEASGTVDGANNGVLIRNDVELKALVIVSRNFTTGDRLVGKGAVAAQDVLFGHDGAMTFDTGFECSAASDCDDGKTCTADSCVAGQCRHTATPACTPTSVNMGYSNTCSVMQDSSVDCWGTNAYGLLGRGSFTPGWDGRPAAVTGLSGVAQMSGGVSNACVLLTNGNVACWGAVDSGTPQTLPVAIAGVSGATAIATGTTVCALLNSGTVSCWSSSAPTPTVVAGLSGVSAITSGQGPVCALLSGGTVSCWGSGSAVAGPTPTAVPGLTNVTQVSAGSEHACARKSDGSVWCWGANYDGRLGGGSTGPATLTPVQVQNVNNAVMVTAGNAANTCVLRTGGTVSCWGVNGNGELGDGSNTPQLTPVTNVVGISGAVAIEAGTLATCALRPGGNVSCWGLNVDGELGDGTQISRNAPVSVLF